MSNSKFIPDRTVPCLSRRSGLTSMEVMSITAAVAIIAAIFIWMIMNLDEAVRTARLAKWDASNETQIQPAERLPTESATHSCDGCTKALQAVVRLEGAIQRLTEVRSASPSSVIPPDQDESLTRLQQVAAKDYLAANPVADAPQGWVSAIVIKRHIGGGGGNQLTIILADGNVRVVEAGAVSEGAIRGDQIRREISGTQMMGLINLGDHLILNPVTFGRTFETPVWILKTGEWRVVTPFAIRHG